MMTSCEVAIIGSGFAGSLLARVLASLGYDVTLIERGAHPRFALGESSTPLANLSLERLAARYGLADCHRLAAHGRWLASFPELRRGLKRGFTFYRHHPGEPFAERGLATERLLVAASDDDRLADTHWLRADVDHHLVREAVAAGVRYLDVTELTDVDFARTPTRLKGRRHGSEVTVDARFVIDGSGPGGVLARALGLPSGLDRTATRSALVYAHFEGVGLMSEAVPELPAGPYPDDWAAVHHLLDEGWMYALRFDDGLTSAGLLLSPRGVGSLASEATCDAAGAWRAVLHRYPTLVRLFEGATPCMPIAMRRQVQHRLARAAGPGWALLPHAFAFVDPLFSTGMAWSLRAVERLALAFERAASGTLRPDLVLDRYDALLGAEADQIDAMVAGAYDAMAHFDLFASHAMLYFATVSYAEVSQRLHADDDVAWRGFLGVGDRALEPLPRESRRRLAAITSRRGDPGTPAERADYARWASEAIEPRNIAGLGDAARRNLYPVDFDALLDHHALLGMSRPELVAALPALRGLGPEPAFPAWRGARS